jgi:hypothetical protein
LTRSLRLSGCKCRLASVTISSSVTLCWNDDDPGADDVENGEERAVKEEQESGRLTVWRDSRTSLAGRARQLMAAWSPPLGEGCVRLIGTKRRRGRSLAEVSTKAVRRIPPAAKRRVNWRRGRAIWRCRGNGNFLSLSGTDGRLMVCHGCLVLPLPLRHQATPASPSSQWIAPPCDWVFRGAPGR